jgi:hypothetical protein
MLAGHNQLKISGYSQQLSTRVDLLVTVGIFLVTKIEDNGIMHILILG